MTLEIKRPQKQQEYRDEVALKIWEKRKHHDGKELAEALLHDEMLKYEYVESLGKGRKIAKKISNERLNKDAGFVIRNLENFDLNNNKIAERLLKDYPIFLLYNLEHFKGLNKRIAIDISCLGFFADKFIHKNIDSFDEDAKLFIKQDFEDYMYDLNEEEIECNKIEDIKTEEVKVRDGINVDYRQWNKSKDVKDYFDRNKFEQPFFEITFDGKKIFLTRLQPLFGGSYHGFVGFIEINGRYEIRYFIKSGSEQVRRCCPGYYSNSDIVSKLYEFNPLGLKKEIQRKYIEAGFNFTGNFSYERSTMVDFRLGQELEKIYIESMNTEGKYHEYFDPKKIGNMTYPNGGTDSVGNSINFDEGISNRCIKMSHEIDITDDFSSKFQFDIKNLTIEKFKEIYESENIGIDINSLQLEQKKKYRYYHRDFGCHVYVDICSAKMLGKDIEIFFSHTENEPDLVWIDNIQYKDQLMNSYGTPAKQINAGWITNKPADYIYNCPAHNELEWAGRKYKDMRPLYQGHPLIKKYKELYSKESLYFLK